MARVYATAAQFTTYTGQAATADTDRLLRDASVMYDAQLIKFCLFQVDDTGMPTDPLVLEAFAAAVSHQVAWWGEVGDSTGAAGVGYGSVEIGSVKLSRSVTAVNGSDSAARQIAPKSWDALLSPDLTPDRFVLGAVCS
jgi:hypothetical protein